MWDFVNKGKYRMYTSSVQKANGNSIEFSLSTQTRRVVKSSQTKLLQWCCIAYLCHSQQKPCAEVLLWAVYTEE